MKVVRKESARELDPNWDVLCNSIYQKKKFLMHAERYNYCNQRYYLGYNGNGLEVGGVVYSLKVNVLTYAKYSLTLPMTIIGIPASVDAQGIVGDSNYYEELVNEIFKNESGLILCLNYINSLNIKSIIEMQTLPSMIHDGYSSTWDLYLQSLRHNYRRRLLKAEKKFNGIVINKAECSEFSNEHYQLYLDIMNRTKTKLEILKKDFFLNLSTDYKLHSFYFGNELITWHITVSDNNIYYFLFGGINYSLRDRFDSYFNNLIYILKEAGELKSVSINLGQTAEVSKNRIGAKSIEKKMFIYHHNQIIRLLFNSSKSLLSYKLKSNMVKIFKTDIA